MIAGNRARPGPPGAATELKFASFTKSAMSRLQRFLKVILPTRWAEEMEADSRSWLAICGCGHAVSIWDLGGVRWKGGGKSSTLLKCPVCSKVTVHNVRRRQEA